MTSPTPPPATPQENPMPCDDCNRWPCDTCNHHYCCEPCPCGISHNCPCACAEFERPRHGRLTTADPVPPTHTHRQDQHMTTNPPALDLLKRTEHYLSAMHGSVARHDQLAAGLGCAGCELRDAIAAALPALAAVQPPAVEPTRSGCTTPCIACMTDESHDPAPAAPGDRVPREEVLAEVVAWLTKKAAEYASTKNPYDGAVAGAIRNLASKVHRGAVRANNLLGADLTTLDPTPLRWGLNDVMWGDDDTITVLLSGPDREPYTLELDLDRAAVLRQDLAGPDGAEQQPETQATGWHLTRETLDLFVRALINHVDYDIHKGYECGEEDGADHYPELVAEAAERLDAITGRAASAEEQQDGAAT